MPRRGRGGCHRGPPTVEAEGELPEPPVLVSLPLGVHPPPHVLQLDERYCQDAPLPFMLSETLPNSRTPSLRGHSPASSLLRAIRHPLFVGRFPGTTGYTAYRAPSISQRDEKGFSSGLTHPSCRAVAHTPS